MLPIDDRDGRKLKASRWLKGWSKEKSWYYLVLYLVKDRDICGVPGPDDSLFGWFG
jgi:hypothetical protein